MLAWTLFVKLKTEEQIQRAGLQTRLIDETTNDINTKSATTNDDVEAKRKSIFAAVGGRGFAFENVDKDISAHALSCSILSTGHQREKMDEDMKFRSALLSDLRLAPLADWEYG